MSLPTRSVSGNSRVERVWTLFPHARTGHHCQNQSILPTRADARVLQRKRTAAPSHVPAPHVPVTRSIATYPAAPAVVISAQ